MTNYPLPATPRTETKKTATQLSAARAIPARRVSFDEVLTDMPKYPANDFFHSHLAPCLSALFPEGEDYFVRSVRNFRDQVTDPELKRNVAGFIGQEAIHGREHRALNDRFADHGYGIARIEKLTKMILGYRERNKSPEWNLAATAALEHFTATFAEAMMEEGAADQVASHEGLRNIFLWHALEECEHKAVAFDVYRTIGGSEKMRIRVMNYITVTFYAGLGYSMLRSMLTDRNFYRDGNMRSAWRGFRDSPILNRENWIKMRMYNRKGFHPNDIDTTHLVEEYRTLFFGSEDEPGELTPLMRSTAKAA